MTATSSFARDGIPDYGQSREQERQDRQPDDNHDPLGKTIAEIGRRNIVPAVRALRHVFIDRFSTIGAINGVIVVVHGQRESG